jgi:HPt (histidine-containing phosphotransfer) domain-containing protein
MNNDAADPIDLAHLTRQTMGDEALKAEVLAMFAEQAPALCEQIAAAAERQARADLLHRLIGSARAIGAWQVAELAGRLERAEPASQDAGVLREAVDAATRRIASLGVGT